MTSSFHGHLVGGLWEQRSNVAGQMFYVETGTRNRQYTVPAGYEDSPHVRPYQCLAETNNSTYLRSIGHLGPGRGPRLLVCCLSESRFEVSFLTWYVYRINRRTGRITFENISNARGQTYLEDRFVAAHMLTVQRDPSASESLHRRVTTRVLRWLFKETEGYDVVQEDVRERSIPDHVVFKIQSRPGGTDYVYDFMLVECKKAGISWSSAVRHVTKHCRGTDNDSKQVYGMVQLGMDLQFYQWGESTGLVPLGQTYHLVNDVHDIIALARRLKANPIPFVPDGY